VIYIGFVARKDPGLPAIAVGCKNKKNLLHSLKQIYETD